ncbi:hypothetical protein WP50_15020 [Lactiplantibacillus plantarum]|nr:hypothetical protein WP50_15020 [Lactiplantibacillus plantarum]
MAFLQSIQPDTYTWIVSGFEDTFALVFEGSKQGNYEQLTGSFLMFPSQFLIFGLVSAELPCNTNHW